MKDNDKIFLTPKAFKKIKNEYNELTTKRRKEVAEKIKAAREEGDISDSAMYSSARKEQAFVEGRIEELEQMLKKAELVDEVRLTNGEVGLGCKVRVRLEAGEDEFRLVSAPEADPTAKKISIDSPLGQAMVGKKVGDEVVFEAPVGAFNYKILAIE